MDSGETFSIGFRTCDLTKKTGGEYIELKTAVKEQLQFRMRNQEVQQADKPVYKKDPKHYPNSTRNIRRMPDGRIIKVHLRLIRRFNSKTVM